MKKRNTKSQQPTALRDLQRQAKELTEALKRERADAENLRRRTEEERGRMATFYKAMIVQELLPAVDNLERSLMHAPKDLGNSDYVKGVQAVAKQFEKAFRDLGIQRVKTVGEQFDPRLHEAISIEDKGGDSPTGQEIVSEELASGYKIGDEIIRHATVRVKRR